MFLLEGEQRLIWGMPLETGDEQELSVRRVSYLPFTGRTLGTAARQSGDESRMGILLNPKEKGRQRMT